MADKYKPEIQKPVKNPLLTNAAFPFDSFSTGSLLVPVSQESSSILQDDDPPQAEEPPRQLIQDLQQPRPEGAVQQPQSTYTDFFNSFFRSQPQTSVFEPHQQPAPTLYQLPPQPVSPSLQHQLYTPPVSQVPAPVVSNVSSDFSEVPLTESTPDVQETHDLTSSELETPGLTTVFPVQQSTFTPVPLYQPAELSQVPQLFQPSAPVPDPVTTSSPYYFTPLSGLADVSTPPRLTPTSGSFYNPSPAPAPPCAPPKPTVSISPFNYQHEPSAAVQTGVAPPPPTLGSGSRSYRLGGQKKLAYAAIPGLSSHSTHQQPPPVQTTPNLLHQQQQQQQPVTTNILDVSSTQQEQTQPTDIQSFFTPAPATNMAATTTSNDVRTPSPSVIPPSLNNLANMGHSGLIYRPTYQHWFYNKGDETKQDWRPFSMNDSFELEQAYLSVNLTPKTIVPTDGNRYDVNVVERKKKSVYWSEPERDVRRCSWFYKGQSSDKYIPYDENTCYLLEDEYKQAVNTDTWRRTVEFTRGNFIYFFSPTRIFHFEGVNMMPSDWDLTGDIDLHPSLKRIQVKRGVQDDFEIEDGEPDTVDHLMFVVHGIGGVCDLKFRSIEEAVDDFRKLSLQLVSTHFQTSSDQGLVNRVEVLPVSWHHYLHGEDTGIDNKLKSITLKSAPQLRNFTNDTLLDILFYTSPVYCQKIMQQVGNEINQLYSMFKIRNPDFDGGVSLCGHSLGSLILFDMLCHQKPLTPSPDITPRPSPIQTPEDGVLEINDAPLSNMKRRLSRNVSYIIGTAGTGQPFITYPQLVFNPTALFAMGSPIGMFFTVRGIDLLGIDFQLPTCERFFNIFHPNDPVAYRIEALINPELADKRAVLIPHHKGRKRMHLELRDTMARVGADLKQKIVDTVRSTWNTVYQLTMFNRTDNIEQHVDEVLHDEIQRQRSDSVVSEYEEETNCNLGRINQGRRVDYVLQETPLESFNEYVSALTSHLCYWDSMDTVLLILKEIYSTMGVTPDKVLATPQLNTEQPVFTMPYPPLTTSPTDSSTNFVGMDPTAPIREEKPAGPPPVTGFVRK